MQKEEYEYIHRILSSVKEASGTRYLYTAKKNAEGNYIYVIDGLDPSSDDFRYPGDLIEKEIHEDMDRALGGEEVYPDEIVRTSWGIFLSVIFRFTAMVR